MGTTVYLDYDADTLYAEYNNRGKVADFADFAASWTKRSDALRASGVRRQLDLSYGPEARSRFDLFLPDADNPPLHAFIHGGYWQWNDKEAFAFLAEPFLEAGIAFASIEYTLCPETDLAGLVDQVRRAFAHLWKQGPSLGYDRERMQVSGHSAGGHLTGVILTTDWPAFEDGLPGDLVKSGMPISGIFDLEPIRHTPIGDPLGLDSSNVASLSPMFAPPRTRAETVVALGSLEGREFHRQAETLAASFRSHGCAVRIESVAGTHHFSVLDTFARPDSALFRAARAMIDR